MNKQLCRIALSGILAAGLAFSGGVVLAQTPGPGGSGYPGGGHRMDPDQQLARMTKRYKLSADQQNQIKPILADRQQQVEALHQDSSLSRDDRRAKMESIRSDSNTKIEAVLNDNQKAKFEQDQQRMQQRMQQRTQQPENGGGDSDQAPPPPPR